MRARTYLYHLLLYTYVYVCVRKYAFVEHTVRNIHENTGEILCWQILTQKHLHIVHAYINIYVCRWCVYIC